MTATVAMVDTDGRSADETLFRLALIDWPASVVDAWWGCGARDPEMARYARSEGLRPQDLGAYLTSGVTTLDALRSHRDVGITGPATAAFVVLGVDDLAEQRAWAHRVDPRAVHRYVADTSIRSIDDIVALVHAEVDPSRVALFRNAGVEEVRDIVRLAEHGVTASATVSMVRRGVDPNPKALIRAAARTLDSRGHADWFRRAGVTSKSMMLRLHKVGVTGIDAYTYANEANIADPADMLRLARAHIPPLGAKMYRAGGIESVDDMVDLMADGVTGAVAERLPRHARDRLDTLRGR